MNGGQKKTAVRFNPLWLAAVMAAGLFFASCNAQQSVTCSASTSTTTADARCAVNTDLDVDRP